MLKTILATIAGALLVTTASAIPINGDIGFNGSGSGSSMGGTSTLTFNNPLTVDMRTGDYAGVPGGTTSNFAPISWTGSGTGAMLTSVNNPEWTFTTGGTTYSFTLLSLQNAFMSGGTVSLSGTGVAFISGAINRDPTFATFSVQGTGTNLTFRIVQTSTSAAAPEGGSAIALLGISLIGLEVLRRKLLVA